MMTFLFSRIGKLVSSALAVLSIVAAIFVAGRRDAKKDRELDDLKGLVDAQERINETTTNTGRAAAVKRLRDNGRLRD
tara:strand:- start:250 stop:483 length:234 start_codon:yes stop_codon:yes gene_type:complete